MTFHAVDLGMLPQQWEVGARVAETARRLPARVGVALGAVPGRLAAVFVEVARRALRRSAEERGARGLLLAKRSHGGVHDQLVVVALRAVSARVLALERKTGLRVIEALLPARAPVHQGRIPSLVLVVAPIARQLRGGEP